VDYVTETTEDSENNKTTYQFSKPEKNGRYLVDGTLEFHFEVVARDLLY
jgi:hypothetical protein